MIGIIHSGQGGHQLGMFKNFSSRIFHDTIIEASDILKKDLYYIANRSSQEELSLTENTQLCVTVLNVAIDRLWRHYNGPVNRITGHSVGEFSAYCSANSFSFYDMLHAVQYRAKIMSEVIDPWLGGMLVVKNVKTEKIKILLEDSKNDLSIACYNTPGQHVITGLTEDLKKFQNYLDQLKIKSSELPISIPCHSKFMFPCVNKMKNYLDQIDLTLPNTSVINGSKLSDSISAEEIKQGLATQIAEPVRWIDTLKCLVKKKVNRFVVFGPSNSNIHKMTQTTFPEFKSYLVHNEKSLEKVLILTHYE